MVQCLFKQTVRFQIKPCTDHWASINQIFSFLPALTYTFFAILLLQNYFSDYSLFVCFQSTAFPEGTVYICWNNHNSSYMFMQCPWSHKLFWILPWPEMENGFLQTFFIFFLRSTNMVWIHMEHLFESRIWGCSVFCLFSVQQTYRLAISADLPPVPTL